MNGRERIRVIGFNGLMVIAAALAAAPLLWMVSASFMAPGEANTSPPPLLPGEPTVEHYRTLFTSYNLGRYFLNSLGIALGGTVLAVLITGMAGYAFAKLRFRGRDSLFRVLLAGMVIPGQVAMLPMFILLREMGLINTLLGAMVPVLAPIYGIFLVRQYALSIPDDLFASAENLGKRLGISRSRLYATALADFVAVGARPLRMGQPRAARS